MCLQVVVVGGKNSSAIMCCGKARSKAEPVDVLSKVMKSVACREAAPPVSCRCCCSVAVSHWALMAVETINSRPDSFNTTSQAGDSM